MLAAFDCAAGEAPDALAIGEKPLGPLLVLSLRSLWIACVRASSWPPRLPPRGPEPVKGGELVCGDRLERGDDMS